MLSHVSEPYDENKNSSKWYACLIEARWDELHSTSVSGKKLAKKQQHKKTFRKGQFHNTITWWVIYEWNRIQVGGQDGQLPANGRLLLFFDIIWVLKIKVIRRGDIPLPISYQCPSIPAIFELYYSRLCADMYQSRWLFKLNSTLPESSSNWYICT